MVELVPATMRASCLMKEGFQCSDLCREISVRGFGLLKKTINDVLHGPEDYLTSLSFSGHRIDVFSRFIILCKTDVYKLPYHIRDKHASKNLCSVSSKSSLSSKAVISHNMYLSHCSSKILYSNTNSGIDLLIAEMTAEKIQNREG